MAQEKKYGVAYSLRGIIKIEEGSPLFYTSDGRVFELDMKTSEAVKYEGKPVEIYAKALQSDMIGVLKPEEINEYNPQKEKLNFPLFFQKGDRLL